MEEIRRTKIKEAMKETLNVYEKLDLNMTEIEIVSRSQNVVAKVVIAKKQLETEAEERLEEQQTPMKIKIIKYRKPASSTQGSRIRGTDRKQISDIGCVLACGRYSVE